MTSPQNLGEEPDSKGKAAGAGEKTSAPTDQGEGVTSAKPGTLNTEPAAKSSVQSDELQAAESVPTSSDTAAEADTPSVSTPDGELDMNAFKEELGDSDLMKAPARIAKLEDQLARAYADLYNLDQKYSGYVRRSKETASEHQKFGQSEVLKALIGVLDDTDAARAYGDLDDGPFASIASKLESILGQCFFPERFGREDKDFDPIFYEAFLANTNPGIDRPIITKVPQPGYRRTERVLRTTKVMVDNPE